MTTTLPGAAPEAAPRVEAVFDDIRATRLAGFIGNFRRGPACDASARSAGDA